MKGQAFEAMRTLLGDSWLVVAASASGAAQEEYIVFSFRVKI
jgi:hypothetical protein